MRKSSSRLRAALVAAALAALTASCSSPTPAVDGTRYDGPPITLTLGTDDTPGRPSADAIIHFAAEVATLSGGKISVEPRWHADGDSHPTDWDQAVAAMVQDGTLDLALAPTSAWDVLGVTSLQPIQAPFLVDSDQLAAAVAQDEDLSASLMSGLPGAGVRGLSLWPEALRHPFGFDQALTSPRDYRGQTVRSPKSDASTRIFRALGAKTTAIEPDATKMIGLQSEYRFSPNGIGVANVTFFAKINVLYANAKRFASLDDGAVGVLSAAAAETRTWSAAQANDVEAGAAFCADGGTVVSATEHDVDALRSATASVVGYLAAAEGNRAALERIRQLKATVPPPSAAAACTPVSLTTHEPGKAEARLNGTYRYSFTKKEFLDAGLTDGDALHNAGVQTFTFADGRLHFRLDPTEHAFGKDTAGPDETDGTYQVDDNVLTLRFPAYDNEVDRVLVETGRGGLTLTAVKIEDARTTFLLTAKPWKKIR